MNFLLRTYSWMAILENNGLLNQLFRKIGLIALYNSIFGTDISFFRMINTQGAVVLGMVYNYLPFMILPIYSVIVKLDHSLIEAARDLGANSVQVFRRVILPLSLPGVLSGITMVFVPSVSTFRHQQNAGRRYGDAAGRPDRTAVHGRRVQSLSGCGHLPCDDGDRGHLHGGHEPLRRGRRTGGDDVKKNNSFLNRLFMVLVFVFLYAPIVLLIVFSFNAGNSNMVWKGFSLHWYTKLFRNRLIMQSVYTTLLVSLLATVIATVAGTFAAIGFYAMRRQVRDPLMTVNNIPMMNADIVTGVSMCLLFVAFFNGWGHFSAWFNTLGHLPAAHPPVHGLRNAADCPHHLQHPLCDPFRRPQAAADGPQSGGRGHGPRLHLDAGLLEGHHPGDQARHCLRRPDGLSP